MSSLLHCCGQFGFAVALLGMLGGCAIDLKDPYNDRARLRETQKEFTQYMRWGLIDKAAQFVVDEQRAEFETLAPSLTELRLTDHETLSVESIDENHARVLVRFQGYTMSSPIERTINIKQDWTFDETTRVWMVSLEVDLLRKALGIAAR
ncbi:MAG: hypothetical protein JRH01_13415 [Deltaproteobacteria bacterium]|nr:hypothetical protein [Deltaproteobacteria bacterium]MBW2362521.1 hypothetical protein [Deltaproteobacteria bacterium]